MLKQQMDPTQLATAFDLENLTLVGFIFNNLLPVTLGNILGGSVLVGLFYWFIYLRK